MFQRINQKIKEDINIGKMVEIIPYFPFHYRLHHRWQISLHPLFPGWLFKLPQT